MKEVLKDYIIRLQHVGHIVADLDEALRGFEALYGVDPATHRRVPVEVDTNTPTLFAFVTVGETEFELIQPMSAASRDELAASPSGGAGINHVAWRVSDIDKCMELLAAEGIGPGHVTPAGVVAFANKKLVYLDPAACNGMLVELIEITDASADDRA